MSPGSLANYPVPTEDELICTTLVQVLALPPVSLLSAIGDRTCTARAAWWGV